MPSRHAIIMLLGLVLSGCGERAESPTITQPDTPTSPTPPNTPPTTTPPAVTPVQRLCPVCGQPVPTEAKYCRKCGSRLP